MHRLRLLLLLVLAAWAALLPGAWAEPARYTVLPDVVYGRKDGLALTLDVIKPEKPNGIGVLLMVSGGWVSSHDAVDAYLPLLVGAFTDRGQTLFAVMHGSQPRYKIPEIEQDIARAVRFVRVHAADWGVDPNRLGIWGISSGGHLSLMQGARGHDGDPQAQDPVDRAGSKVQAVVSVCPPTDFLNWGVPGMKPLTLLKLNPQLMPFAGAFPFQGGDMAAADRVAREVSPITYVTKEMPPTLLIHGDADLLVPIQQSKLLDARLQELGVPHKLVIFPGEAHPPRSLATKLGLVAGWFEEHLGK